MFLFWINWIRSLFYLRKEDEIEKDENHGKTNVDIKECPKSRDVLERIRKYNILEESDLEYIKKLQTT